MTQPHTPGPWSVIQGFRGIVISGFAYEVAHCDDTRDNSPPETEIAANARLIAAAPDMLDALRMAEKEFSGWSWTGNARNKGPYDDRLAHIRAAIAKATKEP